jgi:PAS domain-containing protein
MKNLPSQTTELLESMLEALDQGFIAWDEDCRLVAWNQLFLDFWRLPGHIMRKGKPLLEILEYQASLGSFGEGDPKVVAKAYMATIVRDFKDAAAGSATVEVIVKSESGKWLQMKRRMVEGLGYVTCATDVTEKVASERAANLMYDNIDSFADSVVMVDSDGHIIYSNNRYHEIYPDSPSREEIIGMSQRDLLRRSLDRGLIDDALAKADPDAWIEQKVAERRVDGTTNWETRHSNGRFYQIKQQREKKSVRSSSPPISPSGRRRRRR